MRILNTIFPTDILRNQPKDEKSAASQSNTKTKMASPCSSPTSEFLVFPLSDASSYSDAGIDQDGKPIRKRRRHLKSRAGCQSCKTRKIKCDEKRPVCNNCLSQTFSCHYPDLRKKGAGPRPHPNSGTRPLLPSVIVPAPTPNLKSQETCRLRMAIPLEPSKSIPQWPLFSEAELSNMKLFHHFITYTSPSLLFGAHVWRDGVIPLALQNDFLLHAVLLMASAHLLYLQPNNESLRRTKIRHLCMTMTGFRAALSSPITLESQDALIACSLLVLHHSWADTELCDQDEGSATGNLFSLAAGLRHIVLSSRQTREESIFNGVICFKSPTPFPKCYEGPTSSTDLKCFFEMLLSLKGHADVSNSTTFDYLEASQRLITVLSLELEKPSSQPTSTQIVLDVARYFFLWPAMCPTGYRTLVEQNIESVQMMMLCFYKAVLNMLPSEFWWLRQKSAYMCRDLVSKIGNERIDYVRHVSEKRNLLGAYSRTLGSVIQPPEGLCI